MPDDPTSYYAREVSALLQDRLRIKGRSLERQVARLGRRVPPRVRRDAAYLARAETLTQHPKLAQMIDAEQVKRAGENVIAHLSAIDPKQVALDRVLWILAKVSAFAIAVFIGTIWYLWDQGMI